jgi:hypothetical protein
MQQYIGTKIINAKPMTRLEWCDYRGWTVPENEDGRDGGYLVEYTDGGKANMPEYSGYVSWSPKDVFERAYHPHDGVPSQYPPHQQRVVDEKISLDEKRAKLINFLMTPLFNTLSIAEQGRLQRQLPCMNNYSEVLGERIASF